MASFSSGIDETQSGNRQRRHQKSLQRHEQQHQQDQQKQSTTLDKLYGSGSNEPFRNMRVQTIPNKKPGIEESASQIARELEELREGATNVSTEVTRQKINQLIDRYSGNSGGETCATGSQPSVIKGFTPTIDQSQGSIVWRKILSLVEEDVKMQKVIVFILTGNEKGKLYSKPLRLDLDDVDFVDRLIDDNRGKRILDVISQLTSYIQQNRFGPLILIFVKLVLTRNKDVQRNACAKINTICDIPPKLFLFVSLAHKYGAVKAVIKNQSFDRMLNWEYLEKLERKTATTSPSTSTIIQKNVIDHKLGVIPSSPAKSYNNRDRDVISATRKRDSGKNIIRNALQKTVKKHMKNESKNKNKNGARNISTPTMDINFTEDIESSIASVKDVKLVKKHRAKFSRIDLPEGRRTSRWPRHLRIATASFYEDPNKGASQLLQFLTKYIGAYGWSHRDIIKCTHPKFQCEQRDIKNLITVYILYNFKLFKRKGAEFLELHRFIDGEINKIFNVIFTLHEISTLSHKNGADVDRFISLWLEHGKRDFFTEPIFYRDTRHEYCAKSFHLTFEHIPKIFLTLSQVWEEIMTHIPYSVVLDHLGVMTKTKVFENEYNVKAILSVIKDMKRIKDANINPIEILISLRDYERTLYKRKQGRLVDEIRTALYQTFHRCLKHPDIREIFSYKKRVVLAVDIRQGVDSQSNKCYGAKMLKTFEAALAYCMMTYNFEEHCEVHTFDSTFKNLKEFLSRDDMTLDLLMEAVSTLSPRRPDVLELVEYARRNKIDADVFIVLSTRDDYYNRYPENTLQKYRDEMNRPAAKLIVIGMQCHDFTFADPNDSGMYDICGFNQNVPNFLVQITNAVN